MRQTHAALYAESYGIARGWVGVRCRTAHLFRYRDGAACGIEHRRDDLLRFLEYERDFLAVCRVLHRRLSGARHTRALLDTGGHDLDGRWVFHDAGRRLDSQGPARNTSTSDFERRVGGMEAS